MKYKYLLSLYLAFFLQMCVSQTIQHLSIMNSQNDSIQINLTTFRYSTFDFRESKFEISNNIINLQVCYFPTDTAFRTEINSSFNIPVETNKQYQFQVRTYTSTTNANCNYSSLVDSVSLNFETPIIDPIVLSTIELENELIVYPNPTNGKVKIESTYKIEKMALFDALGKELQEFTDTNEVDLSNFENGIYYIKVFVVGIKPLSRKVIKTN